MGKVEERMDLDCGQVRCVRHAPDAGISNIQRNVRITALGAKMFHQGVVIRRIVHYKGQDLDGNESGHLVVRIIIGLYPSFETIHLNAVPHFFCHILA